VWDLFEKALRYSRASWMGIRPPRVSLFQDGGEYVIAPLFVSVTPTMVITDNDDKAPGGEGK
jgi:hypothetical protein